MKFNPPKKDQKRLGGGFTYFYFHPENLAAMMQFDDCAYFADGLKLNHQPEEVNIYIQM